MPEEKILVDRDDLIDFKSLLRTCAGLLEIGGNESTAIECEQAVEFIDAWYLSPYGRKPAEIALGGMTLQVSPVLEKTFLSLLDRAKGEEDDGYDHFEPLQTELYRLEKEQKGI